MAALVAILSAVGVGYGLYHDSFLETVWASSSLLANIIILDMQKAWPR